MSDWSGQKFGRLTIIERDGGTNRHPKWRMLCDCGVEKTIALHSVVGKSGQVRSCGCFRLERVAESKRAKLDGARVGMLAVMYFYKSHDQGALWMCRCDCGCGYIGRAEHLSRGRVTSCGCVKRKYTDADKSPGQLLKYAANANRRARLRDAPGRFTVDDERRLLRLQRWRCPWCGASLKGGYHRDHKIPLGRGGSNDPSNIELLCARCNTRKSMKDPISWANENGKLL